MFSCLAGIPLAILIGARCPDQVRSPFFTPAPSESLVKFLCERVGMNALFVIFPYKHQGVWVFDDERVGLSREPFVSGADDILDVLAADVPDADNGIKLVFSATPFPGYTARFIRDRSEYGGNWYRWREKGMEGWLCPALLKYFEQAPETIFVKVAPKNR